MTGRRERQKETRRRRIIAAAGQLFATRGYAASSIGDIARRARLAVGTVYNYFPSKPDIVLAIVRAETGGILSAGETLVKRLEESPVEAVAGLLDLYVDLFADFDRELWRELVAAAMTDPSGLGQAFFAQDLRLIGQLDALLQELRGRGDLDPKADPGRGAVTLYGVYLSWFMAYLANDAIEVASLREQVRAGIAVVMHGLIHPERREEDSP